MVRTALGRILVAAFALLLGAAAARTQTVHEIVPGGDTVDGIVAAAGEVDRIPVRLVEGAVFSITLKAPRGSLLHPDLVILGPDRRPDPAAASRLRVRAGGRVVTLRNLPVEGTGLRWIEIRGREGTTGGWLLTTRVRNPRVVKGVSSVSGAQGTTLFPFPSPGNATATLSVQAAKGSAARPGFVGLADPSGAAVPVNEVRRAGTGFSIGNLLLADPGTCTLALDVGTGGDGAVAVRIRWRIRRPFRRNLHESQVITDPVATAVSPVSGGTAEVVLVTVTVDFARPGALVRFRRPQTLVTAAGAGLAVGPESIVFPQSLEFFPKGDYDVEVENPDGGRSLLARAFTVFNSPPVLTGVVPGSGYDDQDAMRVAVTGEFIDGTAAVSLVRGEETIPGTGVAAIPSRLSADFDLRGRDLGLYDVVVVNDGAEPTTLAGAFEIRNALPDVDSLAPADNLDSDVVACTIDGANFDDPPTTALRRGGQPDIPGGEVAWISGGRVSCAFDTAGRAPGAWDLVVINPDGGTGVLAGAFTLSGPVVPAGAAHSPSNAADGPPEIVWNSTRDEFLVGWIDQGSGTSSVMVQRLDAAGSPVGAPVSVSSGAASLPKRDVALAWDSADDLYLVCWSEPRPLPSSVAAGHPSWGFYTSVQQVLAQQLRGSDLSAAGSNVQVSSHAGLSASPQYCMDEFNNIRPSACWDAAAGRWQIAWMQEWDTHGTFSWDDWDVFRQTLAPSDGSLLANPVGLANTFRHEGDPCIVYDPVGRRAIAAWNYRHDSNSYLGGFLEGNSLIYGSGETQDLRMAVDPDAGRLLLTWTESPPGGPKSVLGGTLHLDSPTAFINEIVTVSTGEGDHFLARPMYNPALKQALISWTRRDGAGGLTVRSRRAATDSASRGLVLLGREIETSTGSADEAMPATVWSGTAGESVVLWLKTMEFVNANSFAGAALDGTYRGRQFWLVRYR